MRKVFNQPKAKDRGPAERLLRQLIESDLDSLLSRLTAAERAEAGRSGGGTDNGTPPTGDQPEPDESTERLIEMGERFLAELGRNSPRKVSARTAARCFRPVRVRPSRGTAG